MKSSPLKRGAWLYHRLIGGMNTARQQGKVGLRSYTSLFLNRGCPVCDRPTNQTFCLDCQRQIPCLDQGEKKGVEPLSDGPSVQSWYQDETHSLPVCALGIYGGTLKRAILAMKYRDRPDVAKPLGIALGQQWLNQPSSSADDLLCAAVPIPLHAERQIIRGYNQAELIAQSFCQKSGLPLLANGLQRTHATLPQHQLSLSARQQNLSGAFQIGPSLNRARDLALHRQKRRLSVLLIDDIYTTGTTARSAAETLVQAGIPVIGILAIARAVL